MPDLSQLLWHEPLVLFVNIRDEAVQRVPGDSRLLIFGARDVSDPTVLTIKFALDLAAAAPLASVASGARSVHA